MSVPAGRAQSRIRRLWLIRSRFRLHALSLHDDRRGCFATLRIPRGNDMPSRLLADDGQRGLRLRRRRCKQEQDERQQRVPVAKCHGPYSDLGTDYRGGYRRVSNLHGLGMTTGGSTLRRRFAETRRQNVHRSPTRGRTTTAPACDSMSKTDAEIAGTRSRWLVIATRASASTTGAEAYPSVVCAFGMTAAGVAGGDRVSKLRCNRTTLRPAAYSSWTRPRASL